MYSFTEKYVLLTAGLTLKVGHVVPSLFQACSEHLQDWRCPISTGHLLLCWSTLTRGWMGTCFPLHGLSFLASCAFSLLSFTVPLWDILLRCFPFSLQVVKMLLNFPSAAFSPQITIILLLSPDPYMCLIGSISKQLTEMFYWHLNLCMWCIWGGFTFEVKYGFSLLIHQEK